MWIQHLCLLSWLEGLLGNCGWSWFPLGPARFDYSNKGVYVYKDKWDLIFHHYRTINTSFISLAVQTPSITILVLLCVVYLTLMCIMFDRRFCFQCLDAYMIWWCYTWCMNFGFHVKLKLLDFLARKLTLPETVLANFLGSVMWSMWKTGLP